ncbi:MAG TPA: hypothetical protein VJV77_09475, partial [Casimicrobiaceae bacterium]|nr:hypothetical protein [Casimicrobiaceae bacterium]
MSLIAAGVFVAIVPLGLLASHTLGASRGRDRLALALPLGLAALSVPLAVAAAVGHFAPRVNGVGGWIVALVCTAVLWRRSRQSPQRHGGAAPRWRAGALVVLLAATFMQALAVVETPIGSRD